MKNNTVRVKINGVDYTIKVEKAIELGVLEEVLTPIKLVEGDIYTKSDYAPQMLVRTYTGVDSEDRWSFVYSICRYSVQGHANAGELSDPDMVLFIRSMGFQRIGNVSAQFNELLEAYV